MSGYDATVVCNDGQTCLISCSGDSCNYLTLKCNGTCNFIVICGFRGESSNICDLSNTGTAGEVGYELNNEYSLYKSELNNSLSITNFDNSLYLCNNNISAINCDDFEECSYNQLISNINNSIAICCTASKSCADAYNITTKGRNMNQVK